jgi:KDO transferase-3
MLSFDQAIHHTVDKQDQLTSIQQIELSVYNAIHGLNVMDEVPKTGQGLQLFRSVVKRIRKFTLPRNRRHITRYPLHFFQDIPGISTCRTIRWHRKTFGFVNHIGVLRKKCAGDAFIIASGPSMKHCDISAMNMKHCFALNGSVMKFVEQNRSPGYYVVIDVDVVWNRLDMIRHAVNRGARCFFTTRVIRAICEADQTLLQRADIYLLDPVNWTYDGRHLSIEAFKNNALNDHDFQLDATGVYDPTVVGFSKNLEKGVFPGATVVFPAIQIAYYMGYRRVFILGMDLGAKAGQIRFYDELGQARPSHLTDDYDQAIYPSMMLLKEIQDLDLYNVSLNSRLPDHCMPRISFEDMQAMMQHQQDDCGLANDIS